MTMVALALILGNSIAFSADSATRPNIVLILADDLGWTDTGAYGSKFYETPNIDRMATQGVRFTSYHNCPNCQPTRAALMSGQYAPRTGVYTVGDIDRFNWESRPLRPVDNVVDLPLSKVTVAQALKSAGYATAMFGKWHLGQSGDYHPARRGFDEAIVSMGSHVGFKTQPQVDHPEDAYLADWLTDRALDFITRSKDKPFFLYLPHFGVHSPYQAKPELVKRFEGKAAVGGHHNATYAAMIASVDESVGRVLAKLDELKLAENTLVIFSSDNGGVGGYVREGVKQAGDVTDNAPLRSGKGSLYEGGIRDPFIVRWPGVAPAGAVCDIPAIHVDVFPTLLELSGAKPPEQPLDGVSLAPLFKNPQGPLAREAIFQHFPGYLGAGDGHWRTTPASVIHAGDWKLIEFYEDNRLELYNLREDVGETKNLAPTQPDKARELHGKLTAWRERIKAPLPTKNTPVEDAPKKGKAKAKAKEGKTKAKAASFAPANGALAQPTLASPRPLIRELLGVNGHTVQFKPKLYRPVCQLVRDYHSIEWDLGKDTDYTPKFPFARNQVNWETVYGPWQAEGFEINCSIMFPHTPQDSWKDLDRDARLYGERFAKAFGPSSAKRLVASAEIGNEPGHYDDAHYRRLFEHMAKGLRAGDPKLLIATCAVTTGQSHRYAKSVECVKGLESLYDVINLHSYAEAEPWPTWRRSYPEDSKLRYLKDIEDVIAWRNQHAPGKPVWLTEFGYDSSTKKPPAKGDFAKWQGVSDLQQAQYLVRSTLVFTTLDVARAYIYFFNDSDEPQVHGSSGLTRHFEPKPSYHALVHLQKSLGDYRLSRVREAVEGKHYVYEFAHAREAGRKALAVWSPTGEGRTGEIEIDLEGAGLERAERMPVAAGDVPDEKFEVAAGKVKVRVSESPVYLWLTTAG